MKGIMMTVTKLNSSTYKVILGSAEGQTYYIQKRKTGTWAVAQKGAILDFAPTRNQAIDAAITIFKGVTA
jgi:hypothetical protein